MRMLMLVAGIAAVALATEIQAAGIPWQEDLQRAHAQASAEGKLLLVHFYGDHCVWCERLESGAFQNPAVADAITRHFVPVKVHTGRQPQLTQAFGVKSLPTDVVVDVQGTIYSRGTSPQDPSQYIAMLDGANATAIAQSEAAERQPTTAPTGRPASAASQSLAHAPSGSASQPPAANGYAAPPTFHTAAPPANLAGHRSMPRQESPPQRHGEPQHEPQPQGGSAPQAPQSERALKPAPSASLTAAMDGFCPVTVRTEDRWAVGDQRWGALHLGQLYLFASEEAQQAFLADPDRYAPVLAGNDVVKFFDERRVVAGSREWAVAHPEDGPTFLFSDQESFDRFHADPDRFARRANQLMERVSADIRSGIHR